jgi:hypothetical protein
MNESGDVGVLVPLVSVTLGIGMIIVSIVTKHRRDMQELANRHKERMAAIDKGLDLPPDPVTERATARKVSGRGSGSRYLLRGLVWLGVGLALALSDSFLGDGFRGYGWGLRLGDGFRGYGWIAAAVGVAYLIYYALEGRREAPPPPGNGGPPAA